MSAGTLSLIWYANIGPNRVGQSDAKQFAFGVEMHWSD